MNLEEELKRFEESNVHEQQAAVHAVRELTSAKNDKDDDSLTNMDFKTRLTIREVCAHGCLEWINEVFTEPEMLTKELRIVHLTKRMKRIRVSEEGKAREGIEKIFKSSDEEQEPGWFKRFMGINSWGRK